MLKKIFIFKFSSRGSTTAPTLTLIGRYSYSFNKSLTTKEALSIGIGNVLDTIPSDILKKVDMISFSRTLATNACV